MKRYIHIGIYYWLIFFSLSAFAQQTIKVDKLDLITYRRGGFFSFYVQKGEDKFSEIFFKCKETKKQFCRCYFADTPWDEKDSEEATDAKDWRTLSDISEEEQLIFTKDIRPSSYKEFQGKSFFTEENVFYTETDVQTTFCFINEYMARAYGMIYSTSSRYQYLQEADTLMRWRPDNKVDFTPLVVDIGKNKKIYLLLSKNDEIYTLFVPLKEQNILVTEEIHSLKPATHPDFQIEKMFNKFSNETFIVKKNMFHRSHLVDKFGNKVLPKAYDSIANTSSFIIAKRGQKTDVYNGYLEKLDCGKVKQAYLSYLAIEVLNEQGAMYYNIQGEKMKTPYKYTFPMCGTGMRYTSYKLLKDTTPQGVLHGVKKTDRVDGEEERYTYYFSDLLPTDEVKIDGKENANFVYVKRNGKWGLYVYDYFLLLDPEGERKDNVTVFAPTYIKGKELLPITFDLVERSLTDDSIYIYENGKKGYYLQKKAIYDTLYPITRYFYLFEKNGKKGYLDIKTFQEYFFE